jgi:2-polyprenyl-3-methyl-5-hydroxy-6-metoxy-1,4-benzoquinol methylase
MNSVFHSSLTDSENQQTTAERFEGDPSSAEETTPESSTLGTTCCCRFCSAPLSTVMCDLGESPMANAYIRPENLESPEPSFPLKVWVCDRCLLAQLDEFEAPEAIFSDYAYFSSYAKSWVEHARRYSEAMIERFQFDEKCQVIEIASNDGYLLQHFKAREIPVLGIEPAANIAKVAQELRGIPSLVAFFGTTLAKEIVQTGRSADLLVGNNVLAHVPDLNDFVEGVRTILKSDGIATFEFPHLLRLLEGDQFDTIYHEHFSYFSFHSVLEIFRHHGLEIFDVDELPTHGGSLRIYARREESAFGGSISSRVEALKDKERAAGLLELSTYVAFNARTTGIKEELRDFLTQARAEGKTVVGYGAAAKGVTLLNYAEVDPSLLAYVVDRNPEKQGRYLPGVRIPIEDPSRIFDTKPDFILILPWNLCDEIREQMKAVEAWGGRFVTAIPSLKLF